MGYKYTDDDYCDIYENKICDNCGKCLEMDGVDIKAIKIDEIAKNVEENKVLEEEFYENLKTKFDEEEMEELEKEDAAINEVYKKFLLNNNLSLDDEEYEDAFDHMEYIEDIAGMSDEDLKDNTEEIYPGVRRFKGKKEE